MKKSKHVLAIIRERLGISQKAAKDYLGVPVRTVAAIECGQRGKKEMGRRTAEKISANTGVSIQSLMENSQSPVMVDGRSFTKATFEQHKTKNQKRITAVECFRFYILLCIKLGRVMLAAFASGSTVFTVWQIRSALNRIGESFPEFESTDLKDGVYQSLTRPQIFDFDMQRMINDGKKTSVIWGSLLSRFDKELRAIEKQKTAKK